MFYYSCGRNWVMLGSRVSTLNFICTKIMDKSLINKNVSNAIFVNFWVPSGVGWKNTLPKSCRVFYLFDWKSNKRLKWIIAISNKLEHILTSRHVYTKIKYISLNAKRGVVFLLSNIIKKKSSMIING